MYARPCQSFQAVVSGLEMSSTDWTSAKNKMATSSPISVSAHITGQVVTSCTSLQFCVHLIKTGTELLGDGIPFNLMLVLLFSSIQSQRQKYVFLQGLFQKSNLKHCSFHFGYLATKWHITQKDLTLRREKTVQKQKDTSDVSKWLPLIWLVHWMGAMTSRFSSHKVPLCPSAEIFPWKQELLKPLELHDAAWQLGCQELKFGGWASPSCHWHQRAGREGPFCWRKEYVYWQSHFSADPSPQ